ncbi:hypothetical protein [Sphingomonas sp. Ant20]|uniref:hypothetical protein n=1 Tax=Sphingomonas sp. Ant20 TaxID=104605 RepID=UPI000537A234|nr:hypothetical protein [Sphingomonas sp. Ant20]KHA64588.1 hypothetical protein NI18_08310 [Sphingomonas sp. Ant20]
MHYPQAAIRLPPLALSFSNAKLRTIIRTKLEEVGSVAVTGGIFLIYAQASLIWLASLTFKMPTARMKPMKERAVKAPRLNPNTKNFVTNHIVEDQEAVCLANILHEAFTKGSASKRFIGGSPYSLVVVDNLLNAPMIYWQDALSEQNDVSGMCLGIELVPRAVEAENQSPHF